MHRLGALAKRNGQDFGDVQSANRIAYETPSLTLRVRRGGLTRHRLARIL